MEFLDQQLVQAARSLRDNSATIEAPAIAVGGALANAAAAVKAANRAALEAISEAIQDPAASELVRGWLTEG